MNSWTTALLSFSKCISNWKHASQSEFTSGKNETVLSTWIATPKFFGRKVLCFELIFAIEISLTLNALAGKPDGRKLAGQNKGRYFFTYCMNQLQIFLPPDILWMLEVSTGQIHREKYIEVYCSDIISRSEVLALIRIKNQCVESYYPILCILSSASSAEEHLMEPKWPRFLISWETWVKRLILKQESW